MSHNQIQLANELGERFPNMPIPLRSAIAVFAGVQNRVGHTKQNDRALMAAIAYARHNFTNYDNLFRYGYTKEQAREAVRREVYRIINLWK